MSPPGTADKPTEDRGLKVDPYEWNRKPVAPSRWCVNARVIRPEQERGGGSSCDGGFAPERVERRNFGRCGEVEQALSIARHR